MYQFVKCWVNKIPTDNLLPFSFAVCYFESLMQIHRFSCTVFRLSACVSVCLSVCLHLLYFLRPSPCDHWGLESSRRAKDIFKMSQQFICSCWGPHRWVMIEVSVGGIPEQTAGA